MRGTRIHVFTIKTGITLAVSILVLYVPILVSYGFVCSAITLDSTSVIALYILNRQDKESLY